MRVLVVDDELPAREELSWLLSQCDVEVLGAVASSKEALNFLEEHNVDVIFLDIEMPGLDGMRLGELLHDRQKESKKTPPGLIFVTAYQEKAVNAFEINAIDYLLKPVRLERLQRAITKAKKLYTSKKSDPEKDNEPKKLTRISVEHRGVYHVVPVRDIFAFESEEGVVLAHVENENFVTDFSLKFLETSLDPELFYRCHRGFIVRIDKVTKIAPWGAGTFQLTLSNGLVLPLARSRAGELRALMPATMSSFSNDE